MTYWKTANYLDTAPNEVYCDNTFGPAGTRSRGQPVGAGMCAVWELWPR